MHIKKCPDCGGSLEAGAIIDHTYGSLLVQRYARTNVPDVKAKLTFSTFEEQFNDARKVVNYRCIKCNRLFPYAQEVIQMENVNNSGTKRAVIAMSLALGLGICFYILITFLDAL